MGKLCTVQYASVPFSLPHKAFFLFCWCAYAKGGNAQDNVTGYPFANPQAVLWCAAHPWLIFLGFVHGMQLCFVPVIGRYHIPRIIPLLLLQKIDICGCYTSRACAWGYHKIPEACITRSPITLLLYVHNLLRRAEKRQVVRRRDMPGYSGVSICNLMLLLVSPSITSKY